MKKIAVFLTIIIIIVVGMSYMQINYKKNQEKIANENKIYEQYLNQEKTGTEIATIINKAMDNNKKNNVSKDNKGKYIEDENNSIKIDFKMIDNDKTYDMETFFNGGISTFTSYYREIKFKCTKLEYHSNGKVKYMIFEQTTK